LSRALLLAVLLLLGALPLAAQEEGPAPEQWPVVMGPDTLFTLSTRLGAYSAAQRASAISGRLRDAARDPLLLGDTVGVVPGTAGYDLVIGSRVLMTVTAADAEAAGMEHAALAAELSQRMQAALRTATYDASLRAIMVGVALTILATAAAWLLIRLILTGFARLEALVRRWHGTRIRSVKFQKLELLSAARIIRALLWLVRVTRVVLVLLVAYVYLPLVLSFFPWTRPYAGRLLEYVGAPFAAVGGALLDYLPNIFFIAVIVLVTVYLLKVIRFFFAALEAGTISIGGFYAEWAIPTYQIVRFVVLVFAAIVIFPYLPGTDTRAFQGIGVFLGLLISLGSASAFANIVGGIVLIYMRPFQVGERVKIADTIGFVVEKTLLSTRVRTIKNVDITIPNSMVLGSHIINFSSSAAERGVVLHTSVTIGYDVEWRRVHALLIGAARGMEGILESPEPFVLQTSLDDFAVTYELNAYTDLPLRVPFLTSELHARIQDAFNAAGVEIMSPAYTALRDGNAPAVTEEGMRAGARATVFRVSRAGEE
jgi:small-conductance mechanosensitive channel